MLGPVAEKSGSGLGERDHGLQDWHKQSGPGTTEHDVSAGNHTTGEQGPLGWAVATARVVDRSDLGEELVHVPRRYLRHLVVPDALSVPGIAQRA
eukprot:3363589-Rhodomonas_salina.8